MYILQSTCQIITIILYYLLNNDIYKITINNKTTKFEIKIKSLPLYKTK